MTGTLYGVGVGSGDPKLMTYLAVETIEKCTTIAVPAQSREQAVSYQIARQMIPELQQKPCLNLYVPMTKHKETLENTYQQASERVIAELEQGHDVAYLTLGDPTIYCTYIYLHRLVKEKGYRAEIINGIPSFCAVSARLSDSLVDRSEQLHIIPSTYDIEDALKLKGTKVLMKAASKMPAVKAKLKEHGLQATMVENCGMEQERVYDTVRDIPDSAGYFSVVVVRDKAQ